MIYYKKFDEPVKFTETINDHTYDRVIEGEWVSDNPEVEKVWFTGSGDVNPNTPLKIHIHLITKSLLRFEECTNDTDVNVQDRLIAAAEKWLENLKLNTVELLNKITTTTFSAASNIVMYMSEAEWNKLPEYCFSMEEKSFIESNGIVVYNNKREIAYSLGGTFFRIKVLKK
jgi:hypothetical protein